MSTLKQSSSVHNISDSKPPFGSRFLTDEDAVWTQNAWDHVPPPEDQDEIIAASLQKQRSAPVPVEDQPKYNVYPSRHWDNFYKNNEANFFKDRKWLHNEFPELVAAIRPDAGKMTVAEIGCGAGNSVFPLLKTNQNPDLHLLAYDYSSHAVKVVQSSPLYKDPPLGSIHSAVWDLSSEKLPDSVALESVDIVILVFVLSALHPDEWYNAITNVHKVLKPGGLVCFRDYGRNDLTQLRFKTGRLLDDNFYIRGDKTRVYFFELDELSLLFSGTTPDSRTVETKESVVEDNELKLETSTTPVSSTPTSTTIHANLAENSRISSLHIPHPLFSTEQLGIDRRLIVNRKRQLKMYRVWMQGKFIKNVA